MNPPSSVLSNVQIASPCSASWDEMAGDDRARFCSHCKLHVYNLSSMSREEAESLVVAKEGRLCVRFYQRADGTVMTKDCPIGLARLRIAARRVTGRVAAAFGIALAGSTAGGCVMGVAYDKEPQQRAERWRAEHPQPESQASP